MLTCVGDFNFKKAAKELARYGGIRYNLAPDGGVATEKFTVIFGNKVYVK